ncbi:MAG TPA: c-type cytochrome domain-containing protein [Kofleriaceae bacterium]|nr:c-type cytochrome domain-containing protein [Kofleriaceae bacterium]
MTAAIAAAAAAAGCAADTDERPATFDYIVATILRPSCATATCHDAMTKREGLDFSSVAAAAKSIDDDGLVPIGGGDPDNSQLYYDLTADGIDKRMPIDSPLPDADIELIRQWIVDGAVH